MCLKAGYWIWYRDDSQPEMEEIPDHDYSGYRHRTLDELLSATRGHTVTHMSIRDDIPPLEKIAPLLKQLRLRLPTLPHRDQSDRSVSICISSLLYKGSDYLHINTCNLVNLVDLVKLEIATFYVCIYKPGRK